MASWLMTARNAMTCAYVRKSPITPTVRTGRRTANACQSSRSRPAAWTSSWTMASASRSSSSRSSDPSQHVEETARSVDVDEVQLEGVPEGVNHRRGFAFPEDAVVDEHARELVADRTVDEHGDDGGVDAARERTEDAVTADLGPNRLDGRVDERGHRPRAPGAADLDEVRQD